MFIKKLLLNHLSRFLSSSQLTYKMPRNVEIKARVKNINELKKLAEQMSGSPGTVINQDDTFFNAINGRLKLRKLQGQPSQLIFYSRSDVSGPKLSDYHITETNQPDQLKETLSLALGVRGSVKKHRMLYMIGQTRVHVDQVEGLGDFMELEVVLKEGQSVEVGEEIADVLREKLGVEKDDLITGAYLDLILKQ